MHVFLRLGLFMLIGRATGALHNAGPTWDERSGQGVRPDPPDDCRSRWMLFRERNKHSD